MTAVGFTTDAAPRVIVPNRPAMIRRVASGLSAIALIRPTCSPVVAKLKPAFTAPVVALSSAIVSIGCPPMAVKSPPT